jgi:hypothetical protein
MRARWVLVLFVLASCDYVFRLDRVERVDAPIDIDAGEACRADYAAVDNAPLRSRYRFVTDFVAWPDAEADCEDDSATTITHLVVFDEIDADIDELRAVRNWVIAKRVEETGVGGFDAWAGVGRDAVSPTPLQFYAVTGEAMPQMGPPWETNEPNNGAGAGTNEPVAWFNDDFDLLDGPTTLRLMYVCECDHRAVTMHFTLD